ncbi:hypothetical protein COK03_21655 [Priestia megaterium]|nr:hypothetical protein COK03_21655 [Priestia megaterium]
MDIQKGSPLLGGLATDQNYQSKVHGRQPATIERNRIVTRYAMKDERTMKKAKISKHSYIIAI